MTLNDLLKREYDIEQLLMALLLVRRLAARVERAGFVELARDLNRIVDSVIE